MQSVVVPVLDHPVDGRDDLADVRAAVRRRDFQADDPGVRCDAAVDGGRVGSVWRGCILVAARDEAGHEGSMAIGIEVSQVR